MSELQTINSGINAIWQFIKTYPHPPKDANDAWWDKLVADANMVCETFKHPAITKMMCGYLDYMETEAKWE